MACIRVDRVDRVNRVGGLTRNGDGQGKVRATEMNVLNTACASYLCNKLRTQSNDLVLGAEQAIGEETQPFVGIKSSGTSTPLSNFTHHPSQQFASLPQISSC